MPVFEHDAAAAAVAQQRREVGPRQAVEMDFALGVDLLVQRIVRVHAGIVGVGLARGHAPHRDLLAAAQLALQVAARVLGQAVQIRVAVGEVDGHVGQRLAVQHHEALLRAGLDDLVGQRIVGLGQQRRAQRQILEDGQGVLPARPLAQRPRQRIGIGGGRQQGVLADRGADEGGAQREPARPPAVARQAADTRLEVVVGRRQQIERRGEGRQRQAFDDLEAFRGCARKHSSRAAGSSALRSDCPGIRPAWPARSAGRAGPWPRRFPNG